MSELKRYRLFVGHYQAHKNKIYNYFYFRLSHDVALAEDLTSETFVKAYESFESFDSSFAFSTWIYAIARNVLVDHLRKSSYRQTVEVPEDLPEDAPTFIEILDQHIDIQRIQSTLESLPPAQREAVRLRYFEYKEVTDIAEISNSDPVAVRKNISRGLAALRGLLAGIALFLHL